MSETQNCSALVLAAGKGTRMKSRLPKVMQPILEEPMLFYVLQAFRGAGIKDIAVVVGSGGEYVSAWLRKNAPDCAVQWQKEQLGTGHAVRAAADWLQKRSRVLIVNGDMPMIQPDDLTRFIRTGAGVRCAFATCTLEDAGQYGRVISSGSAVKIVEFKDASEAERSVHVVNAGLYLFEVPLLLEGLKTLRADNAQGEYYIVDLIPWACSRGERVLSVAVDSKSVVGVNDPLELASLNAAMRDRILAFWMRQGVKCLHPKSVWLSPRVLFSGEVVLYPNVQLWGNTVIGENCKLMSGTVLRDTVLDRDVQCLGNVVAESSIVDEGAKLGPFCYIRDGTHVRRNAFVGKYVEIKKSDVGEGTKVPHLSYIGDAVIGAGTNIGAACVTCNYDGFQKHPTHIGENCFIGSDTMMVAPVNIGDGATTGAGSVITKDVPANALGLGRGRQVNIDNWVRRKKQ